VAETVANTPSPGAEIPPVRFRAGIGLAVGLVLGLVLGLAGVTAAVRWENDDGQGPRYRVIVLGFVVFRYPEDGELYEMRPGAQVKAARETLVWASTLAGGIIGWVAGCVYGQITCRSAARPALPDSGAIEGSDVPGDSRKVD
jgi:hypothetical protein